MLVEQHCRSKTVVSKCRTTEYPPPDEISTRRDSLCNSTQAPHKHKVQFTNHCILSHNSTKFVLFQFITDETHLPVATENHYSFDHKLTEIEQPAYKFKCLVRMIRITRWNMPSDLGNTFWGQDSESSASNLSPSRNSLPPPLNLRGLYHEWQGLDSAP